MCGGPAYTPSHETALTDCRSIGLVNEVQLGVVGMQNLGSL